MRSRSVIVNMPMISMTGRQTAEVAWISSKHVNNVYLRDSTGQRTDPFQVEINSKWLRASVI